MADFSVPNYSDLIDNLNTQIASGPPKMDFSGLEHIPQSYYTGQKNQYDQRLRNLFSGGVPTGPDGSPDYTAMSKSLLQAGGASEVPNSISLGNAGLGRQILGATGVLPPSSSNMQPTGQQSSGGPANAIAGIESGGNYSAVGPVTKDGDRAIGKYQVMTKNIGPWTKEVLGQEMSPRDFLANPQAQDAVFQAKFGQYSQKYGPEGAARAWFAGEGGMNNPKASDGYMTVAQYGQRFTNAGGANGAPAAPVQQNPQTQATMMPAVVQSQPPQQVNPQTQAPFAQPSPTPTQNVPNQPTETLANAYEARANYFYQQEKGLAFVNKDAAAAAKAQGDQAAQQALAIRRSLLESSQPTPAMKDANASGAPSPRANAANTEQDKLDIADFGKQNTALQGTGQKAANAISDAQLLKGATLDQKFYSGPLNEYVKTFRQFQSIFGNNPGDAAPMEAFNKVATNMLTDQIKGLAQSGVGRVLMAEVNNMKQGIASLGITPLTNRALAEFTIRTATQNRDLAEIAQKIDDTVPPAQKKAALNQAVMEYQKGHPLFSEHEKQDPRLLGAPDAPPDSLNWSPQQTRMYWQQHGLKPGAPIRIRMGIYGQVP